jgi:hypothetical protein
MPFVVGVEGGHRDRPKQRRSGMTHYLLAVHGPAERDEFGNYGSKEEMEEAFAATGAFNDKLHADGYWVFAGGLQAASTATVVDGQGETTSTWRSSSRPRGPRRAGARSRSVRSTASPEPARATTDRCRAQRRPSSGSSARSMAA